MNMIHLPRTKISAALSPECATVVCKLHLYIADTMRHDIYWLPVRQCIQYKLCTLESKCLRRTAPSYLADTCIPCRLAAHHDLSICRFRAADYSAIWITQLRHFRPYDLELAILPLTILDSTLTGFLKLNCIGLTEHYGGHTAPS